MVSKRIGVGLIGLGEISSAHESGYKKVKDFADIVGVCDVDENIALRHAKATKAKVYIDYKKLLNNPQIEAVDIMLPHHLHYKVAKEALNQGKHVIVEKPLTLVSHESLELIEIAKRRKLKFTVLENTRYVRAYLEAKELITQRVLGTPRLIRTFIYGSGIHHILNPNDWKGHVEGAGILMDAGVHTIYLLKWLFGEIDELQAFSYYLFNESTVEDYGSIVGKLKDGTRFSTEYSRAINAIWSERLEYYGSKGSLFIDQRFDPPAIYFKGLFDHLGTPITNIPFQPTKWKELSIADGVSDFVMAILEDRNPTVDPMDGYYAVKVLEKAYESIRTGNAVSLE